MFEVSTDEAESLSILEQSFELPSKRQKMNKKSKLMYAICQVLLMHDGPLREFSLSLLPDVSLAKIDHIMFHLSKKTTVKTLKLEFHSMRYSGFDSLTTLFMDGVCIHKATFIHLLSNCPLLKTLDINSLTLPGCDPSTITDLFECLPMIEQLSISFGIIQSFLHERVPRELPTTLIHLRRLCLDDVQFTHKDLLSILVLLIKSSPNLEKLRVLDDYWVKTTRRGDSFTPKDYWDVMLEHLNELKITNTKYRNRKSQLDFVKLILAKSPVLKKVRIILPKKVSKKNKSQISGILMGSPCASPEMQIIFEESE